VALTAACSLPEAPPLRQAERGSELADGLPVPDDAQTAVVVSVTDGDTVRLRGRGTGPLPGDSTRVRLLLVDTPEVRDDAECFGPEASARTEQLLPRGATVRVQADADPEDRFGRLLLHVWTEDGVNVGEALVSEGYATVLQIDPNRRYLERFEQRERGAKDDERGLWSACR
jgi:endonuclease YncB( thermonuclease family)